MVIQKTRVRLQEFEQMIALPENQNRRFELINGEMYEKMPTELHAYIIQMIAGFLFLYLRDHPIGYALIEARYRLPGSQDVDLIPDLSFRRREHGPLVSSGAAPYMPDLAVEAQSEGQSDKFMLDKAMVYLENGTRMVWIIYSTKRIVEVITLTERHLLNIDDMVDGGDVLPGFTLAAAEIFPKP